MLGQVEIPADLSIHSDELLGRSDDCCRIRFAEICHFIAPVVYEQGYQRVSREIVPFPRGSGGGEKQVAQVYREGHGH